VICGLAMRGHAGVMAYPWRTLVAALEMVNAGG
jgi:hypothetical protein